MQIINSVRRTFLTLSQDIFLLHASSSWEQMNQNRKNEAHNIPGCTPSPPCPLRKLRGRSWLLDRSLIIFLLEYHLVRPKWRGTTKISILAYQEMLRLLYVQYKLLYVLEGSSWLMKVCLLEHKLAFHTIYYHLQFCLNYFENFFNNPP